MRKRSDKKIIRCECMDFVEASHRGRVYPLMYLHMELEGKLALDQLKRAVARTSEIIPEILYAYDFQKGGFINLGFTADDVVVACAARTASLLRRDLSKSPQLQLLIYPKGGTNQIIAAMSHVLTDGEGFLQYLYLLASLYNGERTDREIKNERCIAMLLKNIAVLAPTEQTRQNRHIPGPPLRPPGKGKRLFCLTSQISGDSLALIRQKAERSGATMNDVFMAAYARVIACIQNAGTVVIPCPADLRRFFSHMPKLTVANMTGLYRNVAVELKPDSPFIETLQQVHIEMSLQKSRYRCFYGVKALYETYHRIPGPLLEQIIKAAYRQRPVSYTNIGIINDAKLHFKDCTIQKCYFTGTYRLPPDFQLTVSTFRDICTLNCTLVGSFEDGRWGRYILGQVKQEIMEWIELDRNF